MEEFVQGFYLYDLLGNDRYLGDQDLKIVVMH